MNSPDHPQPEQADSKRTGPSQRRIEIENEIRLNLLTPEQFRHFFNRVVLGRHGQTKLNELGILQGSTNAPLSPRGRQEMIDQSKKQSLLVDVGLVMSSDMKRAVETAEIFASQLRIAHVKLPKLEEFNYGNWEGRQTKELVTDPTSLSYIKNRLSTELNGLPHTGEKFVDFLGRVNDSIKDIYQITLEAPYADKKRILLISHAEVTRAIRFLYILAKEQGVYPTNNDICTHETRFSYSDQGVFIPIPHGVFVLNLENYQFQEMIAP